MPLPAFLREQLDSVWLTVKLQPRAAANEIVPPDEDSRELRIRVLAPPVDAAANEALIRLLAERLHCARSRVELMRGHKTRHKILKLHGFTAESVLKQLQSC